MQDGSTIRGREGVQDAEPRTGLGVAARSTQRVGGSTSWAGRFDLSRVPPLVVDVVLAVVVAGIGLAQTLQRGGGGGGPGGPNHRDDHLGIYVMLAALPVVGRSRYPLLPLVAAPIALLYRAGGGDANPALLPAILLSVYTVVASGPYSRVMNVAWAAGAGLVFIASHFVDDRSPQVSMLAMDFAWVAAAILLGDNMNNRRALHAVAEQRALEAELTREEEAKRRVSEERVSIARELHDVVAHHISIINVQAGVGAHLMDTNPAQSREAFDNIRLASRATLQELRALVGVLREPREAGAPLAPTQGLEGLASLVRSVREAGLDVSIETTGAERELPGVVDRSAYRILQESLTNVIRHAASATVEVHINYGADRLELLVRNTAGSGSSLGNVRAAGSGHGLEGMRERAEAIGGTVQAGPTPGGGFEVHAVLPMTGGQ